MATSRSRLGSYFLEKLKLVQTREDPLFKARYARAREVLRSSREALVSLKAWSAASCEAAKQSAKAFEAVSDLFPPHLDRGGCRCGSRRRRADSGVARSRSNSGVGSRVVQLDVVHEASSSDGSGRSLTEADACERSNTEASVLDENVRVEQQEEKGATHVPLASRAGRISRIVKRLERAKEEIEGVLVPVFREHVIAVLEDEVETNAKAVNAARSEEKAARRCFEVGAFVLRCNVWTISYSFFSFF